MRFGFSRMWSAFMGLFATAPTTRRSSSSIRARQEMYDLAKPERTTSGRSKCGGPNWLKMAINQQKHR